MNCLHLVFREFYTLSQYHYCNDRTLTVQERSSSKNVTEPLPRVGERISPCADANNEITEGGSLARLELRSQFEDFVLPLLNRVRVATLSQTTASPPSNHPGWQEVGPSSNKQPSILESLRLLP